jgi:hypothetical protein
MMLTWVASEFSLPIQKPKREHWASWQVDSHLPVGSREKRSFPRQRWLHSQAPDTRSLSLVRRLMSKPYRRYELLLPTSFNDGTLVPDELVGRTLQEIRQQIGAVSSETQVIEGHWEYQGHVFRDRNIRVFVDVPDSAENRQFFVDFKERLKERFQQIDIWMTSYPLDVI